MRPGGADGGMRGGFPMDRDGGAWQPPSGFPGFGGDGGMPPRGGGGMGPFGGRSAPLYDGLMKDPATFQRYLTVLQTFLDGPASAEALLANIDIAAAAVGDRIAASALESLRTTIRTRVETIEGKIPSTTECAATAPATATAP